LAKVELIQLCRDRIYLNQPKSNIGGQIGSSRLEPKVKTSRTKLKVELS